MKSLYLIEDIRLEKLPVRYSDRLAEKIEDVKFYNKFENENLKMWLDDLRVLVCWLSNPVIAWDNNNDFVHYNNDEVYIEKYGISYKVLTDKNEQGVERNFVYVIDIILTPQNYNLNVPHYLNENNKYKQYNTMKNTRNRVRLTESQLHNVIKESVKQVLSELDWKTYANAGKKAGSFGDISTQREMNPNGNPRQWFNNAVNARERANKFYDKARDQFNKDYGYSNGSLYDKDASNVRMGGSFTSSEEFSPHAVGYQDKGYGNPYKYEHGRRYDGYHGEDMSPEEFFNGNKDAAESYNNANSEIGNFKKGNYDYEPNGRGWHLKDNMDESIRRAIRNTLK